ncbi:MAG: RNA pseudouridine synthase [Bdellovibrionota bacterium]
MALEIVFENEFWCAAIKPTGMLSVPSRIGEDDERSCFGPALQKQIGARLWPVHRLDFEVSGILIFAKNAEAHRDANMWFETGLIQKTYSALSSNERIVPDPRLHPNFLGLKDPAENSVESWSAPLVRGKRRSFVAPHGKESFTLASWKKSISGREWKLEPLTGRSHQLRVHMALAGFPIAGDVLYGATMPFSDGIALRAWKLSFAKIADAQRRGLPTELKIA